MPARVERDLPAGTEKKKKTRKEVIKLNSRKKEKTKRENTFVYKKKKKKLNNLANEVGVADL